MATKKYARGSEWVAYVLVDDEGRIDGDILKPSFPELWLTKREASQLAKGCTAESKYFEGRHIEYRAREVRITLGDFVTEGR